MAILRGAGVEVSAADLVRACKTGAGLPLARECLARRALAEQARRVGAAPTEEEVAEAGDAFFAEREVFEPEHRAAWLDAQRLTEAELRVWLSEAWLAERWQERVASDEAIEKEFRDHAALYATARIEVALCPTEGAAREVLLGAREGETPWRYDEARVVRRDTAPEETADALFAAAPGEWLGPFETEDERFEVWRVIQKRDAVLDEALREELRDLLVQREIDLLLASAPLEFL